ncbi:MAG TPA: SulP family inorganic anion transporter [Polyangiaceae bacterium]|nr:SulP family inorganic anion transporter [Polyangiaceae bacterium]
MAGKTQGTEPVGAAPRSTAAAGGAKGATGPKGAPGAEGLSQDLLASVVVFLVALPLCMGIAIASGVPPAAGLFTGIVGGLVVGFLQGGPLLVSGPAAGLAVIIWDLVQRHGLAALGPIVLAGGAVQLVAGVARGGRWFRAVPPSVIHGMLAGIGVLIFAGQFHVMVDDKPKSSGLLNLVSIPAALIKGFTPDAGRPHEEAAIIGLATITTIVLWTRFAPKSLKVLPGPLLGVAVATTAANALGLPIAHVDVPDGLLATAGAGGFGRFRLLLDASIWPAALALAVIASAETLLAATAVDRMHQGPRTNYDRELTAQGVGNLLCGLIGALPMTGVIVRSSANVQAGARTRRSTIMHGAWMLTLVAFAPGFLRLIPVSALAAVLVFTGYKLVNPGVVRELRRYGKSEVAIYVITIAGIVATDLLKGVLLGLALAVGKILYHLSRLSISVDDDPEARVTVLHLRGSATFLRLPDIAEALERIPGDRELHVRFDDLEYLDYATIETLKANEEQHRAKGGRVVIDWAGLEAQYRLRGRQQSSAPG